MIRAVEHDAIARRAYVPEHLPAYVTTISGGRPHLVGDFVVYVRSDRLIFVGYPLHGRCDDAAWLAAFETAAARFRPPAIAITAPALPPGLAVRSISPPDAYYRLDLAAVRPPKKVRALLRRAERDLAVSLAPSMGHEHRQLVDDFLAVTPLDAGARAIFERLGRYAGPSTGLEALAGLVRRAQGQLWPRSSPHAGPPVAPPAGLGRPLILEARTANGQLVAFDIAAFGGECAFYLFNFRSRARYVPGASDLLLARLIAEAQARGQRYLNLGLGITPGVSHFKAKWGATPFLNHVACVWERSRNAWEEALDAL